MSLAVVVLGTNGLTDGAVTGLQVRVVIDAVLNFSKKKFEKLMLLLVKGDTLASIE